MQELVSPITRGYIALSPALAAKNYDEFQSDDEIREILRSNPDSILAVTMAHCNQDIQADGPASPPALEKASSVLQSLKDKGHLKELEDFYYIYRIDTAARPNNPQIGLGAAVSADIWDEADNPDGKVIRNEDIFPEKAGGRAELIRNTGHIIGTVNLCTPDSDLSFRDLLMQASDGEADLSCTDEKGDLHRVWAVPSWKITDTISAFFNDREVFVADGNHRSKAAQMAGLDHFLAVIFSAESMNIDPYHRLLKLPDSFDDFIAQLKDTGFSVSEYDGDDSFYSDIPHEIGLYYKAKWYQLSPQDVDESDPVESIDARIIENRILTGLLSLDPADKKIAYVGADYDLDWLREQVDKGYYDCAFSLPAMTMQQFIRLNEARKKLPRKTTWFTPKIRSGMVIEEI